MISDIGRVNTLDVDRHAAVQRIFTSFGRAKVEMADGVAATVEELRNAPFPVHRLRAGKCHVHLEANFKNPVGLVLLWVIDGEATYSASGRNGAVSAGDVLVARSWLPLELGLSPKCDFIATFLPVPWLRNDVETEAAAEIAWTTSVDVMAKSFEFHSLVSEALAIFIETTSNDNLFINATDMLRTIINKAFGFIDSFEQLSIQAKSARMRLIFHYAIANVRDEALSAAEVARNLKISTRTLYQECADHGTTFSAILSGIRLHIAAHQLQTTNQRVSHIAFSVGFVSIPHFCRRFKLAYGMTPKEYRANKGQQG